MTPPLSSPLGEERYHSLSNNFFVASELVSDVFLRPGQSQGATTDSSPARRGRRDSLAEEGIVATAVLMGQTTRPIHGDCHAPIVSGLAMTCLDMGGKKNPSLDFPSRRGDFSLVNLRNF